MKAKKKVSNCKPFKKRLSGDQDHAEKALFSYHFYISDKEESSQLLRLLAMHGLLKYAEGLSLAFEKPDSYKRPNAPEAPRLENEAFQTFSKSSSVLATRIGILSWL